MRYINIILNIQTIKDNIEIEVAGCMINYNKKQYIVSVHQGFPIKSIIINNKIYTDFIICAWCDLIIINFDDSFSEPFVFKQFERKKIEPTEKYFINEEKIKFINHEFIEIGMIPNNPTIMYNCFEIENINNIIAGQPIYNNKLAGIISKIDVENNYIYTIPTNYILTALNKKDNTMIYLLNEDNNNIHKINKYKVINEKIYCCLHKMYIPVNTYVIINSDINYSLTLKNGRIKEIQLINIKPNNYNNNLIINNNIITFTSGFMHLLKLLGEVKLLEKILNNISNNSESFTKLNEFEFHTNY